VQIEVRTPAGFRPPWSLPPVVPEGLADGFFAALGWKRRDLSQLEMILGL
jgi:hypothetical protein